MNLHSLILLCASAAAVFGNVINPNKTEVVYEEGSNVTLFCSVSPGASDYLHWYRQYERSKPEFLVLIFGNAKKAQVSDVDPRFSVKVEKKEQNHVDLEISSAAVSDSALYYCALQPSGSGFKLFMGSGTKLIVDSEKKQEGQVYKVGSSSCLGTDYTSHKEVNLTNSKPVRYTGKNYEHLYSIFSLDAGEDCVEKGGCTGESSGSNEIERDEKINFISLGLFWLRILFLKTVVFNMLMTFKAWMS